MEHLFRHTLFGADGTVIGAAAALTSPLIDLRLMMRVEGLFLRVSSVIGTANCKVQYQTSTNGGDWDAAADNANIVTASLTDKPGNPEGWNVYPVPAVLAPFMRVVVTEISAAGLADTIVEMKLICRELLG